MSGDDDQGGVSVGDSSNSSDEGKVAKGLKDEVLALRIQAEEQQQEIQRLREEKSSEKSNSDKIQELSLIHI